MKLTKGDFSVEFKKTQKLPSKHFHILLSIDNFMAHIKLHIVGLN